jgi:hypothetical protein
MSSCVDRLDQSGGDHSAGKGSCRRRLQDTTNEFQNTLRMRHVITRKRPSITRLAATKPQPTMLTLGHISHARGHAEEAVKAHLEEHGRSAAERRPASAETR